MNRDRWTYANCRERLHALAPHLNHFELKECSSYVTELRTDKSLYFNSLAWTNYNRDYIENPGSQLGYNGRSLD